MPIVTVLPKRVTCSEDRNNFVILIPAGPALCISCSGWFWCVYNFHVISCSYNTFNNIRTNLSMTISVESICLFLNINTYVFYFSGNWFLQKFSHIVTSFITEWKLFFFGISFHIHLFNFLWIVDLMDLLEYKWHAITFIHLKGTLQFVVSPQSHVSIFKKVLQQFKIRTWFHSFILTVLRHIIWNVSSILFYRGFDGLMMILPFPRIFYFLIYNCQMASYHF
jgi:hypothetical protein